ncbi:MAG: zinc-ribbon domain-containing protein [Clostridiaceae bacterium]|nr:zinc-ribbon domain-containing protein [Clostridiaceae bacterium]
MEMIVERAADLLERSAIHAVAAIDMNQLKESPYYPFIIAAVAILVVILLIFWVRRTVRRMGRLFRRSVVGEAMSMYKDAKRMVNSEEFQNTPRSLNGMDQVYRPLIAKDFPDLQVDQLGNQAESLLQDSYKALATAEKEEGGVALNRVRSLLKDSGPYYIDSFERLLSEHKALGEARPIFKNVRVHRRALSNYSTQKGKQLIEFQFAVEALVHSKEHSQSEKRQFKDSVRYQYLEDKHAYQDAKGNTAVMAFKCPNCGAPLDKAGRTTCEYCGSHVQALQLETWLATEFFPELWKRPFRPGDMIER